MGFDDVDGGAASAAETVAGEAAGGFDFYQDGAGELGKRTEPAVAVGVVIVLELGGAEAAGAEEGEDAGADGIDALDWRWLGG